MGKIKIETMPIQMAASYVEYSGRLMLFDAIGIDEPRVKDAIMAADDDALVQACAQLVIARHFEVDEVVPIGTSIRVVAPDEDEPRTRTR